MTGAPLPKGADAVQKVEMTKESGGFIEILEATKEKQNVIRRAEEIEKGAKVFSAGEIITENMIASLASFGYAKLKVGAKPGVSILATGSEIVDVSEKPAARPNPQFKFGHARRVCPKNWRGHKSFAAGERRF